MSDALWAAVAAAEANSALMRNSSLTSALPAPLPVGVYFIFQSKSRLSIIKLPKLEQEVLGYFTRVKVLAPHFGNTVFNVRAVMECN